MKRKEYDTVKDLFDLFIDQKQMQNISSATITNYKHLYHLYDKVMYISDLPVSEFNQEYLQEWHRFLEVTDLKPNTIKEYVQKMFSFHQWLFEEGYSTSKPKFVYIQTQDTMPRFYTAEEVNKLLQKPSNKASFEMYSTYVMICFLLATGVRASTLINIKLSDIDFEGRTIALRHLKNRSQALIPMSDKLYTVIKQFLLEFVRESDDSYLFCTRDEKQVTTTCLRGRLYRYCNKRKVEFKDLHAFRHTYAKNYMANGGTIEKLQKLLTHKSLQNTARYANIFSAELQQGYREVCPLDSFMRSSNKIRKRK